MTPRHETLHIEAGGAAAPALSPGLVMAALARGAGVRAEDIGLMLPDGRGALQVEIASARAARIATPLHLPAFFAGSPLLMTLRREDDAPEDSLTEVLVAWDDGGGPPAPGAFATALAVALRGTAGAESLGAAFFGAGWGRLTLPATLATSPPLPPYL